METEIKRTDEEWKEILGDFDTCPHCGKKTKPGEVYYPNLHFPRFALTCGEHWYDHKYLVERQRREYLKINDHE